MICKFEGLSREQKRLWGESLCRTLITEPMRTEKLFNRKPSDLYLINRLMMRTPYTIINVTSYDYGNYLILHVENLKNRQTYCRPEIFCRIIKEFFGLDIGKYFVNRKPPVKNGASNDL